MSDFWHDTIQGWRGLSAWLAFVGVAYGFVRAEMYFSAQDRACRDRGGFMHEGQCLDRRILIEPSPPIGEGSR